MYKCAFALSPFLSLLLAGPLLAQAPAATPEKTESASSDKSHAPAPAASASNIAELGISGGNAAARPSIASGAELPDQPQNKNMNLPAPFPAPPARHFRVPAEVVDKKFIAFAALQLAATVADFETTQWAQRNAPYGAEQNPLFGSHPSRLRMYSIGLSLTTFQVYMQYRSKRYGERTGKIKNAWIVGALFDTGLHTYLAVHNGQIATRGN
jgi:hypothetical protein